MALVIVLSLIVLLSVFVVGYTITARFDRTLASGYAKADRTELVALSALNHARGLLASNIPDVGPNAPFTPMNWWVAPGRLWTQEGNDEPVAVNLFSGASSSPDDPDLNRQRIDGTYPIHPGGGEMKVAWIPIGRDPSLPVSASNPMVSRFAYWIDVENTRINLRTARRGSGVLSELAPNDSTYVLAVNRETGFVPAGSPFGGLAPGAPGVVDLSGLPGAAGIRFPASGADPQLSNVQGFRQLFASTAAWAAFFTPNQFDVSVWGESPEFTPFGKSRLTSIQNRNKSVPGFRFFWDLENPNQMPAERMVLSDYPGEGAPANEYAYYRSAARGLAEAFLSTEWPGFKGSSLADKWKKRAGLPLADSAQFAEQVAWNLLTAHGFLLRGGGVRNELFGLGADGRAAAGTTAAPQAVSDLFLSVLPDAIGRRYLAQGGNPYVTELGLELTRESGNLLRIKLVGELYTGRLVNVVDVATQGTDVGILLRTAASPNGGPFLVPLSVQFEIPAAQVAGNPAFPGWTVTSSESNLVFSLSNPAPLGSSWNSTRNGRLSAEPVPIGVEELRLRSNTFQVFRSDNSASGGFVPSLAIPLSAADAQVDLSNVRMKVVAVVDAPGSGYRIFQYCPLQDASLPPDSVIFPTPQQPAISIGTITLGATETTRAVTVEVDDPRRCALSDAWAQSAGVGSATYPGVNTLGAANSNWPTPPPEIRGLAFFQGPPGFPSSTGYYTTNPGVQGTVYSPGQLANLWTAPPYVVPPGGGDLSLNLTSTDSGIPDHLVLELINAETGLVLGSNQGTVNPNTRIYPESWGLPPRTKALVALFRRWQIGGVPVNAAALADRIVTNMPPDGYRYRGELIPQLETGGGGTVPATRWRRQALIAALAGRLSTQSSTFGVWGVAQTIRQTPAGRTEVTGEKRFFAVIRRAPFAGVDGVYGNAASDSSGSFTKTISGGGGEQGNALFGLLRDTLDGPDPVPIPDPASIPPPDGSSPSQTIRSAFNPIKDYLLHEVAYFEYLNP